MPQCIPTSVSAEWTLTKFLDSLLWLLRNDKSGTELRFFTYAVTTSGWDQIRRPVRDWMRRRPNRTVTAYVGTDHAITEPDALETMVRDGVSVRLMTEYYGTYHPKLVWLTGGKYEFLLSGSNNITRNAFTLNIEFATLTEFRGIPRNLQRWYTTVEKASEPVSNALIEKYRRERLRFERKRATVGTFTSKIRKEPKTPPPAPTLSPNTPGDLIMEIMPKETGTGGNQIQFPREISASFFGLPNRVGASVSVNLTNATTGLSRNLTITLFPNRTTRLVIRELEFRDRPCVIIFRQIGRRRFAFEIIPQAVFPDRYRYLLSECKKRTRVGSRRFGFISA